ncbi:MAG TPA: carbohydrate kinase family protein [Candidatus Limnocylindria bacterium]|nr:carbohydrate kinase family protein [Candidatus Limnocylindria bacterium]
MAPEVLVLGDALLDVHVTPAQPMRPGADVPAAIRLEPGGQGANLAVRLARRGVSVRLRCVLGDDPAGELVRSALARDGVALDALDVAATGSVVVLLDDDGQRTMLSQRVPLLGAPLPAADAAWLVVSGYALTEPNANDLASQRLPDRRAVVGCALDEGQLDAWRSTVMTLAPGLLVLNADEADALAHGAADTAVALAQAFGAIAVVTQADGARAAMADVTVRASHEPAPSVDTTGAGDAFAAALIARLVDMTWPPGPDALEAALAVAASTARAVTQVVGAQARVDGER